MVKINNNPIPLWENEKKFIYQHKKVKLANW